MPKDQVPADFLQETTALLAKQLEKPEQVSCHFNLRFYCSNNECMTLLLVPLVQNKKKENLNYEINKEYFEVF